MKCPLVSQHAKLGHEREKNSGTTRTEWDRRDGRWRDLGGLQRDDLPLENNDDKKKNDTVRAADTPEFSFQGSK